MKNRICTFLLSLSLLTIALPTLSYAQQSAIQQTAESVKFWQQLQQGGKVVLVRHAAIDKEFASPFTLDETCFSERNLNELGESQATAIGELFKNQKIQIQTVLSSPYCRTKDTAKLAFGSFEVNPLLHLTKSIPAELAKENIDKTRELIGNFVATESQANLILVTHRPNILDLTNVNTQPADMVLLQPLGEGLFEVLAHFKQAEQ